MTNIRSGRNVFPEKNIPFKAAIFDLDGTLLDSMYVWHRVDELFFEKKGLPFDPDYGKALAGKSYRESAEYTVSRYGLSESWEEIIEEWTRLSQEEYARHVQLKPGALRYLRALKRAGIKLAVATALPPNLYTPVLTRHGIIDMFDALCSTNDTGGRGKAGGEVYLLAADKLGVAPEECAVFEDVLEGVMGAKRVGMKAYCVKDSANAHAFEEIAEIAEGMLDSFEDMAEIHEISEDTGRCVIFTAHCEGDVRRAYTPQTGDFILCADGGYLLAEKIGVKPNCVMGDFDSARIPENMKIQRMKPEYEISVDGGWRLKKDKCENHIDMEADVVCVASEKQDTDTMLCVKYGMAMGFSRFLIVGGFGGRLDHTMANIQSLLYAAKRDAYGEMYDGETWATVVYNGETEVPPRPGKLSVFAMEPLCRGVCESNVKYPLENADMTCDNPIGVSNEFMSDKNGAQKSARIRVEEGALLIIVNDEKA